MGTQEINHSSQRVGQIAEISACHLNDASVGLTAVVLCGGIALYFLQTPLWS